MRSVLGHTMGMDTNTLRTAPKAIRLAAARAMLLHEGADLGFRFRPQAAAAAERADEVPVTKCLGAEAGWLDVRVGP